ncbi:MAG: metallophosphoesterase [Theionarchaea archaeon]|nr:metallophosphoesterase [Theionarchaea archaeon]
MESINASTRILSIFLATVMVANVVAVAVPTNMGAEGSYTFTVHISKQGGDYITAFSVRLEAYARHMANPSLEAWANGETDNQGNTQLTLDKWSNGGPVRKSEISFLKIWAEWAGDTKEVQWYAPLPDTYTIKLPISPLGVDVRDVGSGSRAFSFAIIADPHVGHDISDYGSSGWDDSPPTYDQGPGAECLRKEVDWINSYIDDYDIRFVIVLGDLSESAELSEFRKAKEILDTLNVPYVPLIGNHDIWPYTCSSEAPEITGLDGTDKYFNDVFQPQYDYLATIFPNWERMPIPSWNIETSPNHYSYFQAFAFDYMRYHFINLDFNARDDAPFGNPGVSGEADLHAMNIGDEVSSIKVFGILDKKVILYYDADYKGDSSTFVTDDSDLDGNDVGNDKVSSIKIVGSGVWVRLYKDKNFKGPYKDYHSSDSDFGNDRFSDGSKVNDEVSSIKVFGILDKKVILYYDADYKGDSSTFVTDDSDLRNNDVGNDKVSSIKIEGSGITVRLYKDKNFGGWYLPYQRSDHDIHDNGLWGWFKDHFRNYPNKHEGDNIVVIAHHPLNWWYSESPGLGDMDFTWGEYNQVRNFLDVYFRDIQYWFSGHMHWGSEFWVPNFSQTHNILRDIETDAAYEDKGHLRVVRVNDNLSVKFTYSPDTPRILELVSFTDQSTKIGGSIVTWDWDFGDGTLHSHEKNPVHQYTRAGTYKVTLTVTDNVGAKGSISQVIRVNKSLKGIYTAFNIRYDVVELYILVNKEAYSNKIYGVEILRDAQQPEWDNIEPLEAPEGWNFKKIGNGVRFYTGTNPLLKCQGVKFKFGVTAESISWYMRIHVTDQVYRNMGMIVSARQKLYYFYLM